MDKDIRPKLSVVIPTHEMEGRVFFLNRIFESLKDQTFTDFEVCISDNSDDDLIKKVCQIPGFPIEYEHNERKGMAKNTNAAIKMAKGELIKILYLDDWLACPDALKEIVEAFKGHWLITPADNNPRPHYTEDIHTGNNRLGSPSALTILNDNPLMFDESMSWLLDCDYYKRMYDLYGEPVITENVGVNIGRGDHQMTHILTDDEKRSEEEYMNKKHG